MHGPMNVKYSCSRAQSSSDSLDRLLYVHPAGSPHRSNVGCVAVNQDWSFAWFPSICHEQFRNTI